MNPIAPRRRPVAAGLPPKCPRCRTVMHRASREPIGVQFHLHVGRPPLPQHGLRLWRCQSCNLESPRLE